MTLVIKHFYNNYNNITVILFFIIPMYKYKGKCFDKIIYNKVNIGYIIKSKANSFYLAALVSTQAINQLIIKCL